MIWLLPIAAIAGDGDYRSHLDQARFFVKRGWFEDAHAELAQAIEVDDGSIDPEVWWLLANVRLELGDLSGAREAADRAHTHARGDEMLHAASALSAFLRTAFGRVTIDSSPGGMMTQLLIETDAHFTDPAIAGYVSRVRAQAAEGSHRLPYSVDLPAGSFRVNGEAMTIEPGQEVDVTLMPNQIRRGSGSQLWRIGLAAGVGSWLGASDAHGVVTPWVGLGLRRPLGPLSVGLAGRWRPQGYSKGDEAPYYAADGLSTSMDLALTLPTRPGTWSLSVGYQLALIPAVQLSCGSADWECARDASPDLLLFRNAVAHGPQLGVGFEQGDAARKNRWTPGVSLAGGVVNRVLAPSGEVDVVGLPTVAYTVASAERHALAVDLALAITLSHGL